MIALRKRRIRRLVKLRDKTCVPPTCLAITSLAMCTTICPVGPWSALLKVPDHVFSWTSFKLYTGASTMGELSDGGDDFSSSVAASIPMERAAGMNRTKQQEAMRIRKCGDAILKFTVGHFSLGFVVPSKSCSASFWNEPCVQTE